MSPPADSESLIARVCRGEIAALAALYETEAPRLVALALRHTADRRAAEAVVHDVFCELWRRPGAVERDVRDHLVQQTLDRLATSARPPRRRRMVMVASSE
jgi:DNA-directed RNA polymerase specialized sigma24 family protein